MSVEDIGRKLLGEVTEGRLDEVSISKLLSFRCIAQRMISGLIYSNRSFRS